MPRGSAGRPQQTVKSGETFALAEWLNKNIDHLTDLTNDEIATSLGYTRPNIISMWRTGRTRVPLDKLSKLCDILKVELTVMLPLWMEQYGGGDAYAKVVKALRNTVSESEMALIDEIRRITKGRNFQLSPDVKSHISKSILLE